MRITKTLVFLAALALAGCGSSGHPNAKVESSSTTTSTTTTAGSTASSTGPTGPTGPTGATGPTGSGTPGPPGIAGYQIVDDTKSVDFRAASPQVGFTLAVQCPQGTSVLGGGAAVSASQPAGYTPRVVFIRESDPADVSTWTATAGWNPVDDSAPQTLTLAVKAICATVSK